jgi:transcriptional regulator with XRE-family HTH domain
MVTNDSRENLGKIIKQQRQAQKLTLHELSDASGVSPSHLGRIEKGERFPSGAILQRIAKPLGFDEDEIFTLAGYLSPHMSADGETKAVQPTGLDPYVARLLSQEPVEVQRAVVGILTILKSIASSVVLPRGTESSVPPKTPQSKIF